MRAAPSWASAAATASLWKTLRPVARHGSAQLHGITGVCGAFRAARGSRKESLLSGGLRFAHMAAPRPRLGPTGQDGHLQPQVGRVAIGGGHQPQVRPGTPQIHGQLAAAAHRFQAGPVALKLQRRPKLYVSRLTRGWAGTSRSAASSGGLPRMTESSRSPALDKPGGARVWRPVRTPTQCSEGSRAAPRRALGGAMAHVAMQQARGLRGSKLA